VGKGGPLEAEVHFFYPYGGQTTAHCSDEGGQKREQPRISATVRAVSTPI